MIRKGDTVKLKPQWQDKGDDKYQWIAVDDEEKGMVDIVPLGTGLMFPPRYTVEIDWIETNMPACKFTFDDETIYDGFSHGSTWNGFDNVAVTKETLTKICDDFMVAAGDESGAEDFRNLTPMENGLYSLGWGFATQIVKE